MQCKTVKEKFKVILTARPEFFLKKKKKKKKRNNNPGKNHEYRTELGTDFATAWRSWLWLMPARPRHRDFGAGAEKKVSSGRCLFITIRERKKKKKKKTHDTNVMIFFFLKPTLSSGERR